MRRQPVDVYKVLKRSLALKPYRFFTGRIPIRLKGVRVLDVGQGDCVGLLDERNAVVAYVDSRGDKVEIASGIEARRRSQILVKDD